MTRFSELQAAQLAAQDHDRGRAVRVVAGRSQDVDDCMELLAMLGLSADLTPRRDDTELISSLVDGEPNDPVRSV